MTIEEINRQQLQTHPELGWDPANTDMANQRANWLRSLGLVEKEGQAYRLTDDGHEFTESAVEQWADASTPSVADDTGAMTAGTYETTVSARTVDPEFRATVLHRYESTCPISGVDHSGLLDVAHILSWSKYPDHRADLSNVVPLSKLHHAAFDRKLFTIDDEYRLRVSPSFETESTVFQETIVDRTGDRFPDLAESIDAGYLSRHNEGLGWVAD